MIAGQLDLLAEPGVTAAPCRCGRPATTRVVWAADLLTCAYAAPRARNAYLAEHGRHRQLTGERPACDHCEPCYRAGWRPDPTYTTDLLALAGGAA